MHGVAVAKPALTRALGERIELLLERGHGILRRSMTNRSGNRDPVATPEIVLDGLTLGGREHATKKLVDVIARGGFETIPVSIAVRSRLNGGERGLAERR